MSTKGQTETKTYKITMTFYVEEESLQDAETEANFIGATVAEHHFCDWSVDDVDTDGEFQEDDD